MRHRLSIEEINKLIPTNSKLKALYYLSETIFFGKTKRTAVLFSCLCGKTTTLYPKKVTTGRQKSCGCLCFDGSKQRKYITYNAKVRRVYYSMLDRCYNVKDKGYKFYGGKGVTVCDEWRNNPQSFFDWAIMGWKEGLQLDKDVIPKKLGIRAVIYSPEMCSWVTRKENMEAQNRIIWFLFKDKKASKAEICRQIGCSREYLELRLTRGLTPDQVDYEFKNEKWKRHKEGHLLKSKLTEDDILLISKSKIPSKDLAKTYKVSSDTINCIRRGKTWTRITGIKPERNINHQL